MSKKIDTSYNFQSEAEIQNAIIQVLGGNPSSPGLGQFYFNSGTDRIRTYNGATWDEYMTSLVDGDYGDITIGGSGTTLTIDNDAVTYAKIQNVVANNVLLGNNSGAGGTVEEITGTEATAILDVFTDTLKGLVPASGGGTSTFLRADGTFATPAGGFADFDAGGDSGVDVTVDSGDLYEVVGDTGITTTIAKVGTTATLSVNLDDTAVTPSSYGSASQYIDFTVDQQGRITSASEGNIGITESQITNLGTAVTMNADTTLAGNGWFLDDDTMAANDATKTVSQQSLVAFVGAQIATAITNGMDYKGAYNAATNTPALDTGSPSIEIGDTYAVTVAGTFFGVNVEAGDILIANNTSVDAANVADWDIVQANLTPTSIKSQYESNADTNAFTDAEQTLLGNQSGVNTGDEVSATTTVEGVIELATQTEVNTGTDTTRAVTPATLQSKLGVTGTLNSTVRFTQQIGNGSSTTIVIAHNIGRQFVTAQVFETSSPYAQIECDIELDSVNATSFTFNVAPSSNEYTVVIVG